ncbi:hypothetical protein MMC11_005142 [Xylographa trunciseda]|nr:hypothetical protein [Xylographa trunciseda]
MSPNHENATQPVYGHRLIPTLVDELAESTPNYVFALVPRSAQFADGLKHVTISTFARAVNRAASWMESTIGNSADFETIAYLGPADLRYYIIAIAASKLGYTTLLPSPRNSVEGHLSLFDHTKCNTLLSAAETKIDHILAERPMRYFVVATLDELLAEGSVAQYAYNKTFEDAAHDPFIVIHTSGSTGLPKPITLRQGGLATIDAHHLISPLNGCKPQVEISEGPARVFSSLPPFHVKIAGVMLSLAIALYFNETIIWPPPGRPVSIDMVEDLLDNVSLDVCFVAPSILEEMSQSESSLKKLEKVKYVETTGGPLSKIAGDKISKYTNILNALGSSESSLAPIFHKDPEDWIYFHYDPKMKGIDFREIDNGVYEQFVVRHPSTDPFHSLWYTFPDKNEISTHDLFSKHPSKPDLWMYMGRSDDLLVFSNGEKYNPLTMESTLLSHPAVNGAIVVGHARFQPAALIELKGSPPQSDREKQELLDSFKPYVAKVNDSAPGFAKLRRDHVAFIGPDKPMLRTDKGTIKRSATAKLYEKEIDKLYADAEDATASLSTIQLDARDQIALTKSLRYLIIQVAGLQDIRENDDIFAAGADSLQVMNLVRQLRASFTGKEGGIPAHLISPRIVYSNPTASKMAKALRGLLIRGEDMNEKLERDRTNRMEDMLAKYSKNNLVIILTGSTGSLGSYLLDYLLRSPQVSRVICLNRGQGEEKQKIANASRGLISEWDDKVSFLSTDLSKARLGLSSNDYDLLVREASFIIHNQWQVDFNLSLESFEPHIAGVRDLIDLSSQSSKKPPILFTSSISTLGHWLVKHPGEKVPERAFHDFSIPTSMGYGESKYVAEQLLELAAKKSGVSAAICRIGQLAGPVNKSGMWSKQEWLPSVSIEPRNCLLRSQEVFLYNALTKAHIQLVASSKYLGKVPKNIPSQDTVQWVPVDATARIIVELVLSDAKEPTYPAWTKYHNIINPHYGSWKALIPTIVKNLGEDIEPVSFGAWFDALEATAAKPQDVAKNPAIKLLEWFEQMKAGGEEAELETAETATRSETLRGLTAVGPEWMEIWLKQWDF